MQGPQDPDAPRPMTLEVSDEDVRKTANYGPPPEGIFGAPSYVLRVQKRQKELKEKINEINEWLKKNEAERDGAEAQLGQAAIDFGLVPDAAEEIREKVEEAEKSISTAKGQSTKETEHHKKEIERVEAEIAELRAQLGPVADNRADTDDEISSTEIELRRLKGALNRLQIELRNISQGPSIDRAKTSELQGKTREHQANIQKLEAKLAQLNSEASDDATNQLRKKLAALEKKKNRLDEEYQERLGKLSETAKLAFAWRRSRLAVAGRKVYELEQRPKLLDGDRLFARIDQSREKVAKVQAELELHLKALDAFDADAFEKTRYLAYGMGGVVALILLILLLYAR